eukprot:s2163_g11.t1
MYLDRSSSGVAANSARGEGGPRLLELCCACWYKSASLSRLSRLRFCDAVTFALPNDAECICVVTLPCFATQFQSKPLFAHVRTEVYYQSKTDIYDKWNLEACCLSAASTFGSDASGNPNIVVFTATIGNFVSVNAQLGIQATLGLPVLGRQRQRDQSKSNCEASCNGKWKSIVGTTVLSSTSSVTTTPATTATTATTTAATTATTTTLPTTSTTEDMLFSPVDGGVDQVCRGSTPTDNALEYFTVASVNSLEECKQLCMANSACKGIEHINKRCEIWTRPEGIGASDILALQCGGESYVGSTCCVSGLKCELKDKPFCCRDGEREQDCHTLQSLPVATSHYQLLHSKLWIAEDEHVNQQEATENAKLTFFLLGLLEDSLKLCLFFLCCLTGFPEWCRIHRIHNVSWMTLMWCHARRFGNSISVALDGWAWGTRWWDLHRLCFHIKPLADVKVEVRWKRLVRSLGSQNSGHGCSIRWRPAVTRGSNCCVEGLTCVWGNEYYSQCLQLVERGPSTA